MTDTTPDFQALYRARLMAISPAERLALAASMFESARAMILASLQDVTDPLEKRRQIYDRTYGTPPPIDWS